MLVQNRKTMAFAPPSLNSAITEGECLAVIWVFEKFQSYFNAKSVKIITNHRAFEHLTFRKNMPRSMIQWTLSIGEFNIQIQHRLGSIF